MEFAIIVTIIALYSLQLLSVCSEYLYPSSSRGPFIRPLVGRRVDGNVGVQVQWQQPPYHRIPQEAYHSDKVNWKEEGF